MERRRLLQRLAGLGAAAAVGLAGCTRGEQPGGTGTPTDTRTPTDGPTETRPPRTPTAPERYTRRGRGDGGAVVASEAFDATVAFHAAGDTVRAIERDGEGRWTAEGAPEDDVEGATIVGTDSLVVAWTGETRAYDPTDGSERWRAARGCVGPPAVVDDRVVLVDQQGRLVGRALSRDDERWTGALGGTPTGLVGVGGSVAVATRGPGDSALVRTLDPGDGSERWQVHPGYEVTTPPVAVDGRAVVGVLNSGHELGDAPATASPTDGAASGAVVGCADGTEAWTTGVQGRVNRLLAGGSDRVFAAHEAFVFERLERRPHLSLLGPDGTEWTRRPAPASIGPVVTQGAVALSGRSPGSGDAPGDPVTLTRDQVTGDTIWRQSRGADAVAAAGDVFVVADGPRVRALDAPSGRERWTA
jgi:hypothetical protein